MAWKNVFSYMRGMAGKHGMDGKARREDEGLPMGARIGSVVQMQKGSVIRAQTNGSLIAMPADGYVMTFPPQSWVGHQAVATGDLVADIFG